MAGLRFCSMSEAVGPPPLSSDVRPLHRAMNIRYALILAVTTGLFLIGCTTTPDERHLERLMRHHSWPRIQQVAETEVKKREKILRVQTWPDTAAYLPMEHKDKIWVVMAMTGTPKGDVERTVMLMIGDDTKVLEYKRYWGPKGEPVPEFPDAGRVR